MSLKQKIDKAGKAFSDFTLNDHWWIEDRFVDFMQSEQGLELLRWVAEQASVGAIEFISFQHLESIEDRKPAFPDWWAKFSGGLK